MNKKLEFCVNVIRCQVYEMWSQGDRVACGVITDDTKVNFNIVYNIVFRILRKHFELRNTLVCIIKCELNLEDFLNLMIKY